MDAKLIADLDRLQLDITKAIAEIRRHDWNLRTFIQTQPVTRLLQAYSALIPDLALARRERPHLASIIREYVYNEKRLLRVLKSKRQASKIFTGAAGLSLPGNNIEKLFLVLIDAEKNINNLLPAFNVNKQ